MQRQFAHHVSVEIWFNQLNPHQIKNHNRVTTKQDLIMTWLIRQAMLHSQISVFNNSTTVFALPLNTALREKCPKTELFLVRIQSEYWKIQTRNNSVFGHFSRSAEAYWVEIKSSSTPFASCNKRKSNSCERPKLFLHTLKGNGNSSSKFTKTKSIQQQLKCLKFLEV